MAKKNRKGGKGKSSGEGFHAPAPAPIDPNKGNKSSGVHFVEEPDEPEQAESAVPADDSGFAEFGTSVMDDLEGLDEADDKKSTRAKGEHAVVTAIVGTNNQVMSDSGISSEMLVPFAKELDLEPLAGRFDLYRRVKTGGQAELFAGVQRSTGAPVAIKMARRDVPGILKVMAPRLEREMAVGEKMRHVPGIVKTRDYIRDEHALVMDYVDGETLEKAARRMRGQDEKVRVIESIARTVAGAHEAGIVHRDLKPDNILVDRDGTVWVLDFGLSRDKASSNALTGVGGILGSPGYMSPEQAEGDEADERADVYSLGIIAKWLFTGREPIAIARGDHQMDKLRKHALNEQRPVYAQAAKDGIRIPMDLQAITEKMTATLPEDRYNNMEAVLQDLERFRVGVEVTARRHGPIRRMLTGIRHNVRKTIALIVLMGLLAFLWWQSDRIDSLLDSAITATEQKEYGQAEELVVQAIRHDTFGLRVDQISRTEERMTRTRLTQTIADGQEALRNSMLSEAKTFAEEVLRDDSQHPGAKQLLADVAEAKLNLLETSATAMVDTQMPPKGNGDFSEAEEKIREILGLNSENRIALRLRDRITRERERSEAQKNAQKLLVACTEQIPILKSRIDTQAKRDSLGTEGWTSVESAARQLLTQIDDAMTQSSWLMDSEREDKRSQLRAFKADVNGVVDSCRQSLTAIGSISRFTVDEIYKAGYEQAVVLVNEKREPLRAIAAIEGCLAFWRSDVRLYADKIRDAEALLATAQTILTSQQENRRQELQGLRDTIATLNGDVAKLNSKIGEHNTRIGELNQQLQDAAAGKLTLEGKITDLNAQLTQVKTDLATATSNAKATEEKLKSVEADLTKKKEDIAKLESQIETFKSEQIKATEQLAATKAKWNTMGEHIAKAEWTEALIVCEELVAGGDPAATIVKNMLENKKEG